MATAEDNLMDWLRDAHAMEKQAEKMLQAQAGRIEHYGPLKTRIEKHIDETRRQAERLERCIERRGGSTSTIKDLGGQGMAMVQAMTGVLMTDEVVKGMLTSYSFEHMEMGSYRILAAAAEAVGDTETKQACETNLREEEAMAAWLDEHFHEVTQQFLAASQQPGATAKR